MTRQEKLRQDKRKGKGKGEKTRHDLTQISKTNLKKMHQSGKKSTTMMLKRSKKQEEAHQ